MNRDALLSRFLAARAATVRAVAPLSPEDMVVQSMPDASPAKWHLAHTSWFFETFVLADQPPFHPDFNYLFNSYYDAVGDRHPRPQRGLLTRPAVDEVMRYRKHVDAQVTWLLESANETEFAHRAPIVELGVNHEEQHLELLLTDIKHALSLNPLKPCYREGVRRAGGSVGPLSWTALDLKLQTLGHAGDGFSFDNEGPAHPVYLLPFEIAHRPITSGEFQAFIDDGGYRRPEFWLSDGWGAKTKHGWDAPAYWELDAGSWTQFTLGGMRPVEPSEPVTHVSFYEADAYARWAGARLPTEYEWEVASAIAVSDGRFLEEDALHPSPAPFPGLAVSQMHGEVWQWTQSPYVAYPGFRPAAGALGEYNGKFMCNQMVLRGSSCVTPRAHARNTYRNFFPPEARWQFTGFRLARSS